MPDPANDDLAPDDFSDLTQQPFEWDDVLADFPSDLRAETELPPANRVEQASTPIEADSKTTTRRPRFRLPTMVFGLLLVVLGLIFVWPQLSDGYILVPGAIVAIGTAGIALSLLASWLSSGRTARGAFFLAVIGVLWGALIGAAILDPSSFGVIENWPLFVAALGVAIFLTFAAEKRRDMRLVSPALILTSAGAVALLVTRQIIPENVLVLARDFWPVVAIALIVGLLPLAFRRTSRKGV